MLFVQVVVGDRCVTEAREDDKRMHTRLSPAEAAKAVRARAIALDCSICLPRISKAWPQPKLLERKGGFGGQSSGYENKGPYLRRLYRHLLDITNVHILCTAGYGRRRRLQQLMGR